MSRIVMLLSNEFKPDPRVAHEAEALTGLGHEVIVICWDREGKRLASETIDNYRIERIQNVRTTYGAGARQILHTPRFWRAAVARVRELHPDVIHCHDLDTLPVGWWLKRRHALSLVYDAHEDYARLMTFYLPRAMTWALASLERYLLRNVDFTISASSAFAEKLQEWDVNPLIILGNYPRLDSFDAVTSNAALDTRAALGITPDDFMLVYIGGFSRTRQLEPLLDAAAQMPDVQLFIWGDGHQRTKVASAAADYTNIHYEGWLPANQVPLHFVVADAIYYCLVPGYPGWPNTLSNSMAAGSPIIANDVGDLGRIVRETNCGILIDSVNSEAIVEAVAVLQDDEIRRQMGQAGSHAAHEHFNWNVARKQLAKIYSSILESSD